MVRNLDTTPVFGLLPASRSFDPFVLPRGCHPDAKRKDLRLLLRHSQWMFDRLPSLRCRMKEAISPTSWRVAATRCTSGSQGTFASACSNTSGKSARASRQSTTAIDRCGSKRFEHRDGDQPREGTQGLETNQENRADRLAF